MEKHVMVIYPHPDDESFGGAGTIAKFRRDGVPVSYLCGTLGEMGRNMGSPAFANRETLPEIREQELEKACDVLDVDLYKLGYRDKTIEFENKEAMSDHLLSFLEDIQPSLVITHYPGYAVHPDHDAMGARAIEAVQKMAPEKRPVIWAQAISNDRYEELGTPDIINDVTDVFDRKMDAIMSHRSQASGILGQINQHDAQMEQLKEEAKERLGTEEYYIWNRES